MSSLLSSNVKEIVSMKEPFAIKDGSVVRGYADRGDSSSVSHY